MTVLAITTEGGPVEDAGAVVRVEPTSVALRDAIAAGAEQHDWLWILERAVPQPGALRTLLAWAAEHPDAQLLAARVERADGTLHFGREWPDYGDIDAVIAGADVRALPLRAASFHGLLLRSDAVRAHGLPLAGDSDWRADWEYTGRLLRSVQGWLVPSAVVRLAAGFVGIDRAAELRNALWVARSSAWGPRERFDRHFQWAVAAAREPDRGAVLKALRGGARRRPR